MEGQNSIHEANLDSKKKVNKKEKEEKPQRAPTPRFWETSLNRIKMNRSNELHQEVKSKTNPKHPSDEARDKNGTKLKDPVQNERIKMNRSKDPFKMNRIKLNPFKKIRSK